MSAIMNGEKLELVNLSEFNKAAKMLRDRGISYEREDRATVYVGIHTSVYEQHAIKAVDENGDWVWDFVCSSGTYGSERGLLEYWDKQLSDSGDDPKGWLTAEEVVQLIEERGV